jgi:hypothetical protein
MDFDTTKDLELTTDEKIQVVSDLKKNLEENFIQLGQLLSEMKRSKLFKYKGYPNFKEFVESEFNFSSAFANKIVGNFDLFILELDVDEHSVKQIGLDKLNVIKPLVRNSNFDETEEWIKDATELSTTELKEKVKEIRERQKDKEKTLKEVFTDQYVERMTVFFNCNRKELDFKLALFFQDSNLDEVKNVMKINERKFEEQ